MLTRGAALLALLPVATLAGAQSAASPAPSPAGQWRHYSKPIVAAADAPNILLILTDDVGFGAASSFGGPIATPALDALAAEGLRYTQFHTTAMCSPTRAALLTGRNHHAVASGAIGDMSVDEEGYTSVIPQSAATIGRVFRDNGYATAWIGKNHNTPKWENRSVGPFDRWPNGFGFDYFYGFNGADTDQFGPALIENRNPVEPPRSSSYILDKDLADHAINWLRLQQSLAPGRPFLLYYAPGSTHMPNQAPAEWIARFRGRFDMGWDRLREQTFARQKQMGVIPADAQLTPRPPQLPAWDSLGPDERRVAARMMEVYAAQLAYCDDQVGRVIAELKRTGALDNTLVVFIQGDNGGATEILKGSRNSAATFAGVEESTGELLAHLDELGAPRSSGLYPSGWAWAANTPFQWGKQIASHLGGMRNGMVVSWPDHIRAEGGFRTQFHHVVDIAPTLYEAAGIRPPESVDGVAQQPIDGVSMKYSFNDPAAPSGRRSQYFEMLGNRAFYQDGWLASTTPTRASWMAAAPADAVTKWELYDLRADYAQARDLAATHPAKLEELKAGFMEAARRNHVLPIDPSFLPRFDPSLRPSPFGGRRHFVYGPSASRLSGSDFPDPGKDWTLSIDVDVPASIPDGVLISRGDRFSGWGVLIADGRPTFLYRSSGRAADTTRIAAADRLTPGPHRVAVSVTPRQDGGGLAATLAVDGAAVGTAAIPRRAYQEGHTYIGRSGAVPLADDLVLPPVYEGTIGKVELSLGGAGR